MPLPARLLSDIRGLIGDARQKVARSVNSGMVLLYWNIGRRIREDILNGTRASYGEEIVSALAKQLAAEFGQGYSRRNLFNMIRFAEVFPHENIVHALSAQLSWTHLRQIVYLDASLKRDFYAERDIEDAILRDIERFILELGVGFSFCFRAARRWQSESNDLLSRLLNSILSLSGGGDSGAGAVGCLRISFRRRQGG